MRRLAAWLLTAGALLLLARASGWPVRWAAPQEAWLRIAIGAKPERLERCRELSPEELAARPAHMRQPVECQGHTATYRLAIGVDGELRLERRLRGGGLRHDRLVSVLEEFAIPAGTHQLRVELARIESPDSLAPSRVEAERHARQAPLPERLLLAETVTVAAGQVGIVTYDMEQRQLRYLGREAAAD